MKKKVFLIPEGPEPAPRFGADAPWLAPMAGYSDLPFRLLCSEFGAATCVTEMISARGLCHKSPGTSELLRHSPAEAPLVAQLFGEDEQSMAQAVKMLRARGWLWLDCNLGCPARKVMAQGAGSALLAMPEKVLRIASAMLDALNEPADDWLLPDRQGKIGFKLRLGKFPGQSVLPDLALRLEDAGAAWLTLHPRYGKAGFTGEADWNEIAKLAPRLSIPLLASGDLFSAELGLQCLEQTGASGVMYARGALQDPAIFRHHLDRLKTGTIPHPSSADLLTIIKRHIFHTLQCQNDKRGFNKMRSIIPRYSKHFRGVGALRRKLCLCEDWEALEQALDEFMETAEKTEAGGQE